MQQDNDSDRPATPVATQRSNRKEAVYVRLTAEERAQLVDLAEQLGITTSELVRRSFAGYATAILRGRKARKSARSKGSV